MKPTSLIVLVLFLLGLVITLLLIAINPRFMSQMEMGILCVRQGIGAYIAAVAGLAILLRCLNGKGIADIIGLVITVLAGLAIAAPQWPTTIALGVVVFAYLAKETIGLFRSGESSQD
jgi:hypothetical protein